jgi:hypothetical protein
MQSKATTPDEYIAGLPEDRKAVIADIRAAINKNIPAGFKEQMCYGMIGWVVPHELYPPGYHCDPTKPLMLMSLASTKGHISLHHMGLYGSGPLTEWFRRSWAKATPKKLDMGKACVRFKKPDDIPVKLIGELASKLTPQQWVEAYEKAIKR